MPSTDSAADADGSISGHVFKADGTTVITDALISVHAHGVSDGASSLGTYASQIDGSYSITGLAPGTYKVQANNMLEPDYATEYYNDQRAWDDADLVEVLDGQNTDDIDFALEEGGVITGYVYEEDGGTPVQDACVNVSLTAPEWTWVVGRCCGDEDGGFAIGGLPADNYYVRTYASCRDVNLHLIDEWYSDSGSVSDGELATPVEVFPGQTTADIDFSLDLGGAISGHVYKADETTVITDTQISVHAHDVSPGSSSLGTYPSQADGSYTIGGLAPGTYKVQANNTLQPGYVTKYYDDRLTWDQADTVAVSAGQVVTSIDFALEESGAVTGYVYEQDGTTPVADACVDVSLTAPEWTHVAGWCCTDEEGRYEIASLLPGSYYLRTYANCADSNPDLVDEWYAEGGSTPDGNQADPIEVLAGQTTGNADFTLNRIGNADLEYTLTIDDPSSGQATVAVTVTKLTGDVLEIEEHGYHGLYVNVLTLSARDPAGNLLSVEHLPDSGSSYFDQRADVWRIDCGGLSELLIEYTVQPGLINSGNNHVGYIAADYAVLAGEYVFLVPRDIAPESVAVTFDLPSGWKEYIPWTREGNSYDPALSGAPVIESLSVSDFALGQFDVCTRAIGNTEVAVAVYAKLQTDVKEELWQRSFEVFEYVTSVFGCSVGDYYLAIHPPLGPDGLDIVAGEWSNSGGSSWQVHKGDWAAFEHMLFHRWNGWAWGMSGYYPWFGEGPNELYEMKATTELRLPWPYGNMQERLQGYYEEYLRDYVDTGRDQPLASMNLDTMQIYHKGAMAAFLIAKEIYLRTDGVRNFDDLLQILVQKYGHYSAPCSEDCLKAELAALTGTDFTDFFDDYVYATVPLPMDWAFEDDDGDGLSNALEIGWDTDPEDPDTDGDGYNDALETRGLSDPLDPTSIPHLVYLPSATCDYVSPALPIEIDGKGRDWQQYMPAATDPQGDTTGGPHTDMKAVYTEMGPNYVYLMVEAHDPPLLADGVVEFQMDLVDSEGKNYWLATHADRDGFFSSWVDTDGDGEPEDWSVTANAIAWEDVMEARISLDQLGGPTRIDSIFVNFWCEVDGEWTWVDIIAS
jgi:hypothetical protein